MKYNLAKNDVLVESKSTETRMHRYVNFAKALFNKGQCSNGRTFHVCFAVRKGKVIAIGINDYNRRMDHWNKQLNANPKFYGEASYALSLHAEISALLKLGLDDCSDIDFYNVRINKSCHCCNSKPCDNCQKMLKIVNAKHVFYYSDDMKICKVN